MNSPSVERQGRRLAAIGALLTVITAVSLPLDGLAQGAGKDRKAPARTDANGPPAAPSSTTGPAGPASSASERTLDASLPEPVAAMRNAILAAARSGEIENMRTPLEWNELKPEIATTVVADPIAYWKQKSADGQGRQILAVLAEILEGPPARIGQGTAGERYVWPDLAERDPAALTPPQHVQLLRLVSPDEAKAMRAHKRWTWWRLSIGADGTWHSFIRAE